MGADSWLRLIVYLPPNTTSNGWALDAGIFAAFKQHFRTHLLGWHLNEYDTADGSVNLAKTGYSVVCCRIRADLTSDCQLLAAHTDSANNNVS